MLSVVKKEECGLFIIPIHWAGRTSEPDQIISAVYDYTWNVLHLCSGSDCFSSLNCLLSNTGLSFNFSSAFDGLPKASDSLFHAISINGRLGTFVKTPNFFGSFSIQTPGCCRGPDWWVLGMEQLCICWKEWKAGCVGQNNRSNNLHVRGAKLQERKFTIIVGKTKEKWRETCYAVWKQKDFLLCLESWCK